jgi:molecular chaperone DnaJ
VPKNLSTQEKKLYEELAKLETKDKESNWEKFKNLFKS